MRLLRLGAAPPIAILLLAFSAASAMAIDPILDVQVKTWHAGTGRAYVGVQAAGQWAPPTTRSCVRYYSTWDHVARIDTRPVRDEWFVKAHTCSGSTVNPLPPRVARVAVRQVLDGTSSSVIILATGTR